MIFPNRTAPRWLIFIADITVCAISIVLAYLLRFNFKIPVDYFNTLKVSLVLILCTRIITFLFSKIYSGIIRYTGTKDAQRIFIVVSTGTLFFAILNIVTFFITEQFIIPFSIVIIDYLATVFGLITFRILVKVLFFETRNPYREKRNVIIYGAGESGLIAKRTLDRDAGSKYKVFAFLDDDPQKLNKKMEGVTIYGTNKLSEIFQKNEIAHLIISIQNISQERKKEIVETCLSHNTKILNVPPVNKWINGELSFKQIKKVNIVELLERAPIILDEKNIKIQIQNKVILVTGAAGSIGSEIVRQLAKYHPLKIILLDQAESSLYELEIELLETHNQSMLEIVIGDVRSKERMENLFQTFKPQLVYHAAAYKHVPLMENNPSEAILTNVLGTKNMADLAVKYGVSKFVMVSTDKAVNPTNVMGASKRIAEIYTQSLNNRSNTKFVTTRFGNVLGSNGSVIPIFQKQIEQGGPIKITHPEITRYFMTIPEACQLVLEAGTIGKGGEIFIFDMGKSVKIIDLAKKMVKLSGLELGKDIQIIYTGLRPGEKLYEELLNDSENTLPTHHAQIMIAKVSEYNYEDISEKIGHLIELFYLQDNVSIVSKMKEIIPEYISNNSIYSGLDKDIVEIKN